jgi:chemotaxis protein MotB
MRETNLQMRRVIDVLKEAGLEGSFDVFPTKEGFAVRLSSPLLFDLGSADLREEAKGILSRLADILASFENTLRIEGHTDNIPIHTPKFPSNWELSAARALSVLKFLNSRDITSERLSAVGYGEFRPLLENDTEENRDKNRRVEIHVKLSVREKPAFRRIFMNGGFDG